MSTRRQLGLKDLVSVTGAEIYTKTFPPDPQRELRRTNPVAYWKQRPAAPYPGKVLDAWGGDKPTAPWLIAALARQNA